MPLTVAEVRRALDALIYTTTSPDPVPDWMLIAHEFADGVVPDTPEMRRFVLNDLLTTTIQDELCHLRRVYDLPVPDLDDPVKVVEQHIALDARTQNPVLIGASWLYYRYVRDDLNFSQVDYSKVAGIDERTVRRYQRQSVDRLTATLFHRERVAQREHTTRRLRTRLPSHPTLYGRESLLAHLRTLYERTPHLQITGAAGVGKSALVAAFVRDLIDDGLVRDLVWMQGTYAIAEVRDRMRDTGETLFVLDDADDFPAAVVDDLATQNRRVIVIARRPLRLTQIVARVEVPPLTHESAQALIHSLASLQYLSDESQRFEAQTNTLIQQAGGNPGRIRDAVDALWLRG